MSLQYMYNCSLWKTAFDSNKYAEYHNEQQKLQLALESFRENCEKLAAQIAIDFPEFTVHDISHIDSLWEMAALIAGEDYVINPAEAFVLGGAILIHDLGMAAAAYVDGVEVMYSEDEWRDIVSLIIRNQQGFVPTIEEINNASAEIKQSAVDIRLRQLHAKKAEELPAVIWKGSDGQLYRLLDNQELLIHFGEIIGLIAASHWWNIEEVESRLSIHIGAPPFCPYEWEVDVLKLACLLRCADAAHIDSRRAPSFLRVIRKPKGESDLHWRFQEKLARPVVRDDLLTYSSRLRFTEQDSSAWWLAFEAIQVIDKEIKQSNQLLREKGRHSFTVQGVKGADNPLKLADYVIVSNWKPIDTSIHISDVPKLVKRLGGSSLYGPKPYVALRELMQNSRDAIVARRKLHKKDNDWGSILISVNKDIHGDTWLSISDDGLGMTERAIRENLLDFGKSYWGSHTMLDEQPGLISTDFSSTGKYGIGFYSVFMLGDRVEVLTRSIHKGPDGTLLLKFGDELSVRPILLNVNRALQKTDPGTETRICIKDPNILNEMLIQLTNSELIEGIESDEELLAMLCRLIAPTIDVDVYVQANGSTKQLVIKANDWLIINEIDLVLRTKGLSRETCSEEILTFVSTIVPTVTTISSKDGKVLGRLGSAVNSIWTDSDCRINFNCPIACGGFRSSQLNRMVGIVLGEVSDATRNNAVPLITANEISNWATGQAHLVNELHTGGNAEILTEYSSLVNQLGGCTGPLPICESSKGYLSSIEILSSSWPDKIAFIDFYDKKYLVDLQVLDPSVIIIPFSGLSITNGYIDWPFKRFDHKRNMEYIIIELLCSVKGKSIDLLLDSHGHLKIESEEWIVGTNSEGSIIRYLCNVIDFSLV